MATRLYIPAYRVPPCAHDNFASPGFASGWTTTSSNETRIGAISTFKQGSTIEAAVGSTLLAGTATNPSFTLLRRYMTPPLSAQTISGTIKGVVQCYESSSALNATLAIALRVVAPNGSIRGELLAVTAPDSLTHEFDSVTVESRQFRDASENASISLSSVSAQAGDRIVMEIGIRQASTSTSTFQIALKACEGMPDMAENETTTANDINSWIEFSIDLVFADDIEPYFIGIQRVPDDNGSNASTTITLTPKSGLRQGDLVFVFCQSQAATTWSVGVAGGQNWTSEAAFDNCRIFWCTFNGTWNANPRFDSTSGTSTSAQMLCYRGLSTSTVWAIDVAQDNDAFSAPSSPFEVTRAGLTTLRNNCVVLAGFETKDDNDWTMTAAENDNGWMPADRFRQRNTAGNDMSIAIAHNIRNAAGSSVPTLTMSQATVTGDAGFSFIIALSPQGAGPGESIEITAIGF